MRLKVLSRVKRTFSKDCLKYGSPNCWMHRFFSYHNIFQLTKCFFLFRADKTKKSNFQLFHLFSVTQKAQAKRQTETLCISILKLMHSPEVSINCDCKLDGSWGREKPFIFKFSPSDTKKINFYAWAGVVESVAMTWFAKTVENRCQLAQRDDRTVFILQAPRLNHESLKSNFSAMESTFNFKTWLLIRKIWLVLSKDVHEISLTCKWNLIRIFYCFLYWIIQRIFVWFNNSVHLFCLNEISFNFPFVFGSENFAEKNSVEIQFMSAFWVEHIDDKRMKLISKHWMG